jgi:signal transduction histidine kinase
MVVVALAVTALGAAGIEALSTLRMNVDRWAAIDDLESASGALTLTAQSVMDGRVDAGDAAVAEAFDGVSAALDSFEPLLEGDGSIAVLRAPLEQARAAHHAARRAQWSIAAPLTLLDAAVSDLSRVIGGEVSNSLIATQDAQRAAGELDAAQRRLLAQTGARTRNLTVAVTLRDWVSLFERTYNAGGVRLQPDLSALPDCDGGECGPSSRRVRELLAHLAAAQDGPAMALARRDAIWAVDGYVRTLREAVESLSKQAKEMVDAAARERGRLADEEARRRSLLRLSRVAQDMRALTVELTDAIDLAAIDSLERRFAGLNYQLKVRGVNMMSQADDAAAAQRSDELRLGVQSAWTEAVAAKRENLLALEATRVALDDLAAVIVAETRAVRARARDWIASFTTGALTALALIGAATGAMLLTAHSAVARPLEAVTRDVMRLASGDVHAPVHPRRGAFGPLFDALETLRRASLERLRLERAESRAAVELAREQAEAVRLEAALTEEKAKIAFWKRFISVVNHELRTPLAVIDGQARRIERLAASGRIEDLPPRLRSVRGSVATMTQVMETFLLNASAEAGRLDFTPVGLDLKALVRDVCAMHAEAVSSHRIEADLEQAPGMIEGDARLLRQALANLLSNAVKYSPRADCVSVRCWVEADRAHIAVIDRGVGVPPDEIAKLGEQFFRASTHDGISGTGVGLSLVRTIAETHGGTLDVASQVGVGSTFTLSLPLRQIATAPEPGDDHGSPSQAEAPPAYRAARAASARAASA